MQRNRLRLPCGNLMSTTGMDIRKVDLMSFKQNDTVTLVTVSIELCP